MKGIVLKFWTYIVALIAAILVILWLFQIVYLKNQYTTNILENIEHSSEQLITYAEQNNGAAFVESAYSLAFRENISIQFFATEKLCVFNSDSNTPTEPAMTGNEDYENIVRTALSGEKSNVITAHPKHKSRVAILGLPVKTYDGTYEALVITSSLQPIETMIDLIRTELIIITILLMSLALMASILISRTMAKPIKKIEKATKRIAEGDYNVRVDINSKDEIGSLANSVNNMANELSKIDELRKDMIANVSHDLRTPLSLIRGYAETIKDVTGDNKEKREKQLGVIIDETERLDLIVSDMLNLSVIQSGTIDINPAPFEVLPYFESIISRYENLAANRKISLSIECPENLFAIGDKRRLEQVFFNLLNNAFNHTDAEGTIKLSALPSANDITFKVSDTGSGIAQNDLPFIFDRYYKSEIKERKIQGTGLGLAIVKSIYEAHNAEYGIDSKIGEGSTFWFVLKKYKN